MCFPSTGEIVYLFCDILDLLDFKALRADLSLDTDLYDLSPFVLLFLLNLLSRLHGERVKTLPFFIVITP